MSEQIPEKNPNPDWREEPPAELKKQATALAKSSRIHGLAPFTPPAEEPVDSDE